MDFVPLIAYEKQRRVVPLTKALDAAGFSAESLDRLLFWFITLLDSDGWLDRFKYADLTATAASIVAALHIPDPTAEGFFQMPMRPRQRGYRLLDVKHSYVPTSVFSLGLIVC